MKNITLGFFVFCVLFGQFSTFADDLGDPVAIQACLKSWGKNPFKKENPKFRILTSKVKVFGIGKNSMDDQQTAKPELILIKPNVSVLSKSELSLLNPNGWYCLKGNTQVLGKLTIKLHCKAHLASSKDGTTVMGGSDKETGVTVLGTSRIELTGCATP